MIRSINIISKLLNYVPVNLRNILFHIVLNYFPFRLIKIVPCSYSTYLKCYTPRKGDFILDCGAHIGNCAVLFSRLVGKEGLVIALEPFEESFNNLQNRIQRLRRRNIIAINKGVWNNSGRLPLKVFSDPVFCKIVENINVTIKHKEYKQIDCVTIDDLVNELELKRLDMIKMDIEGAEIEALQGSENTLRNYSPCVAIASYHKRYDKPTYHKIEKILYSKGYCGKTFFPPHLTTCGKKNYVG